MTPEQEQRLQEAVCDELRAHRARKRLTQRQLADRAGISVRTANRIDQGEHAPTMNQLSRLCQALDIEVDAVLEAAQRAIT